VSENAVFQNMFGHVTHDRITFKSIKPWRRGDHSQEDIPLRHVTSIRVETTRHLFGGLFLALVGLLLLRFGIGIIPLAWGIIRIWGYPTVSINTAGHDLRPSQALPWQTKEANDFAVEVRKQLFKES
jgi:hypothetical protein